MFLEKVQAKLDNITKKVREVVPYQCRPRQCAFVPMHASTPFAFTGFASLWILRLVTLIHPCDVSSTQASRQIAKARHGAGDLSANGRNNEMVQEMRAFRDHVKETRRDISETGESLQSTLNTLKSLMMLNLPNAGMQRHLVGEAPVDTQQPQQQTSKQQPQSMMASLKEQVLAPLDKWLLDFQHTKEKNHKCEALRVERDGLRKSVSHAEELLTQLKAKGSVHQVAQAEVKLEAEMTKERYLSAKFSALEAEVHHELIDLIRFILDLRKYIFRAVQILQDNLAAITALFDFSAAPVAVAIPPPAPIVSIQQPTQPQQQQQPEPQADDHIASPGQPEPQAEGGYDHIIASPAEQLNGFYAKQFYHSIPVM